MEYIYACLLLHKLGKPVNEDNLKKVISAAGAQIDEAKVKFDRKHTKSKLYEEHFIK